MFYFWERENINGGDFQAAKHCSLVDRSCFTQTKIRRKNERQHGKGFSDENLCKATKKKKSPYCCTTIPLSSFMNLTWWRKPERSVGLLNLLGERVIIVYYFNKSHTILSLPASIWCNDKLNIQCCAAAKKNKKKTE